MAASTPSMYVSPRARVTVMQYTPEALNGISRKQSSRGDVCDRGQTTFSRAVQCQDPSEHSKPNCSYNCLVGMALKSSKHQRLPVNEMYSFFLNKFPYFRSNAPEGWKNSIRHCLSLGPYFRKTQVAGFHGKKGFQWEAVPDKLPALEQEIAKFLAEEGKMPQHFGIESLYSTGFRLFEALSPAHHKWGVQQHRVYRPQTASNGSNLGPSTSLHQSPLTVPSTPQPKSKVTSTNNVQSNTPELLHRIESEPTAPTMSELGGILAYLKDGAPPETAPQYTPPTATGNSIKSSLSQASKEEHKSISGNDLSLSIDLDLQIDDGLEERVKELASSWAYSPSLNQRDVEDWLCLELVDDVDMDVKFDGLDLSSVLISDSLDADKSLNELNFPSALFRTPKSRESPCQGRKTVGARSGQDNFIGGDELLKPADDWNMWNEPKYAERMVSLCNSLNNSESGNLMEHEQSRGGKIRVKIPSPSGSKTTKMTKKLKSPSSKRIPGNQRTPNITRTLMKKHDGKKKISNMVDNHRKVYSRKLAALRKAAGSSDGSECSCHNTGSKDATPHCTKKHGCKHHRTHQLIVSFPFDCLMHADNR